MIDPRPGDPLVLDLGIHGSCFAVVLSVNSARSVVYLALQNGTRGEMDLAVASTLVDQLRRMEGS